MAQQWFTLRNLPIPVKTLFTGYIMVVGLGLLMAGVQIMLTHGMADGKVGLSVDDIIYSYYGNRTGSKLESKLDGSMKDKAPLEVRTEIIKWVHSGAPEAEWQPKIQPIMDQYCVRCHSVVTGIPDLTKFEQVKTLSAIDQGASFSSLTRISHIHLFGISFIFFFVGLIFSMSEGFNVWLKSLLIFTPFAFLIVDVGAWWLTKIDPNFAWFVIVGGFGYSLASTIMLISSLYQMWFLNSRSA